MDSKLEFAKELPIQNETQNSTLQGLELQQIKKECTDDEYLNFTSVENVKVYFDVPTVNNNSDHSNTEFAEEKIYVKEENGTSESLEVREIKSEFIDVDACGQDVEFNFDVPAGNNSNEIDNLQIEFSEEKIYFKKENDSSESWEAREVKCEFVDGDTCDQDVEFNFDVPAGNHSNEIDNLQIEFSEEKIYVKKENDSSENWVAREVKCEFVDGETCGQDVEFNFDVPAGNHSNEMDNSQIEFLEEKIYVKKEYYTSAILEVQDAKVGMQLQSRGCKDKTTAAIINTHPSRVHVQEGRNGRSPTALQSTASERLQSGAKLHTCVTGNQSFKTRSSSVSHERIHSCDIPYKCTVCNKLFANSSNLIKHERIHSGDKPHKCTVCNKAFVDSSQLTRHKRTHSGEKPYKCTVCYKAFADSSLLTRHKRTHSGEKPYECTVCNKAFADTSTLIHHKRIHSGEKPYQCTVCNKAFRNSSHLTRHKRTHNR